MHDPSYGVVPPLQNHLHLISSHRFPLIQSLGLDQAVRYLLDAPTIVSKTAAMSWHYVSAPQEGTVWLEWISSRYENRFPSDGYIWGDPETTYRQDVAGYTIELMVHSIGYRPLQDHHTTHARTRYHIIAKNPAVHAAAPDPSLWIVHYHHADPGRAIPVQQVPMTPLMNQTMMERRALEARGRIDRRDFMLHDRDHWPTISIPGTQMQQPGVPVPQPNMYAGHNAPQNRFPQMPGYQQAQGPPAKRPRYSGPPAAPGPADGMHDSSIEDEENIALGDFFDHLTPREVSLARYTQHHRWIEEIFSSPYATSRIVPPDLGLGLMGELKGLTDGLLDAPSLEDLTRVTPKPPKAAEATPFTNLKKEQLEEFNRRVERHLQEGQAEIDRMKEEHAIKMAEWKKSKGIMQAERRLRYATWQGHESGVPVFRVDVPEKNGQSEPGAQTETIESVVEDVEALLGKKVGMRKTAEMVQKGGYEEEEEPQLDQTMHDNDLDANEQGIILNPIASGNVQSMARSATEPDVEAQTAQALPHQNNHQQQQQQQPQQAQAPNGLDDSGLGDVTGMDDMDIDVDNGINIDGVDFGDIEPATTPDANSSGAAATPAAETTQRTGSTFSTGPVAPQPLSADPVNQPAGPTAPQAIFAPTNTTTPTLSQPQPPTTTTNPEAAAVTTGDNLFDDSTFAELADIGGGDGGADDDDDGLIDFEGGLGMEDSAFGDAMHGMDAPEDHDHDASALGGMPATQGGN